jgi:hypothetical protein
MLNMTNVANTLAQLEVNPDDCVNLRPLQVAMQLRGHVTASSVNGVHKVTWHLTPEPVTHTDLSLGVALLKCAVEGTGNDN